MDSQKYIVCSTFKSNQIGNSKQKLAVIHDIKVKSIFFLYQILGENEDIYLTITSFKKWLENSNNTYMVALENMDLNLKGWY